MRLRLGSFDVDALPPSEVVDIVALRARPGPARAAPLHIVTFNSLMYLEALHNRGFARVLSSADMLLAESSGIAWAARFLGLGRVKPAAGIDLVLKMFEADGKAGFSFYFLGGAPGVAAAAAENISKKYPSAKIAGSRDGFFTDGESEGVAREVSRSGASVLLVGMGSPRQEIWINENKRSLAGVSVAVGVGGAFDVWAGRVRRAPACFRKLGAEWLWRLMSEPSRISRIARLPMFAAEIVRLKIKNRMKGSNP